MSCSLTILLFDQSLNNISNVGKEVTDSSDLQQTEMKNITHMQWAISYFIFKHVFNTSIIYSSPG